jgi:hypothetical protein
LREAGALVWPHSPADRACVADHSRTGRSKVNFALPVGKKLLGTLSSGYLPGPLWERGVVGRLSAFRDQADYVFDDVEDSIRAPIN